jgi:hypothetical protein
MKRIFIFLWAFVFTCTSQSYLNSSASWWQQLTWSGIGGQSSITRLHYFMQGDSTLEGHTYYKLFQDGYTLATHQELDSLGMPYAVTDSIPINQLRALIREQGKKFLERQSDGTETILYNFDVSLGSPVDSMVSTVLCPQQNPVVLQSQGLVCIGTVARKQWMLSQTQYPSANSIIEGVGPNTGLYTPICRNGCPECGYQLLLFTLNGDTLYQGDCDLSASLEEQVVSPTINIRYGLESLELNWEGEATIELTDLMGRVHHTLTSNASLSIPFDGLMQGHYILTFRRGPFQTHRFIWIP